MLHGIDPRISPDLLYVLAQMGHGDEIVIADANYPAVTAAMSCVWSDLISYPGYSAVDVADLVTQVMPLDTFDTCAALRMEVDGAPDEMADVHQEVFDLLRSRLDGAGALASIARPAFYTRAQQAFAVVQCSEARAFGCFILRKGVIF